MSFQTFVMERLTAITEALNKIGTNAKKIDDLPVQSNLDPSSKIHVSRGGNSESLQVQLIIDAINSNTYDQLLSIGEITLVDNVISIPADARAQINQINYNTVSITTIPIPYAATGLTRTDILVFNTSNLIVRVPGTETAGIAVRPNIPINTVLVTEINVTELAVGDPSPPVTLEALSTKLDKDGYAGTAKTLDDRISAVEFPDIVLKSATPIIQGLNISVPADSFEWRINQIVFDNTPALSRILTAASNGFYRKDVLLGTNTNSFLIVEGAEGDESVTPPTIFPEGTILLGVIDIFGNTTTGFLINDTSKVSVFGNGGETDYVEVNKLGSTFDIRNATSLTGFTIPSGNIQYGKDYYLRNSTGGNLTLKSIIGSNNIRFYFPDGDLVVPLNNNVHLKYLSNNEFGGLGYLTLVGISYNDKADKLTTYTKTEVDAKINNHFKSVYLTEAALFAAHPTASVGDYAQVNEVGATDVVNYNWDAEENIWVKNEVAGSGATNTNELPEGTSNLYFQTARVLATVLTGISFVTGGEIVSTDSILVAFGKLQKQISDHNTATNIRTLLGINTLSGSNTGDETTTSLKSKIDVELAYACSDETSNLTVGNLISFRVPFAMTLSSIRISVNDAPTVSSVVVDVKEGGVSIFSTLLSIDSSELTSVTAAVPAVISDINLADDALITVSTTQIGSGNTGKGLKILFKGKKA